MTTKKTFQPPENPPTNRPPRELADVSAIMSAFGVSRPRANVILRDHVPPAIKLVVGRRTYLRPALLRAWLEGQLQPFNTCQTTV